MEIYDLSGSSDKLVSRIYDSSGSLYKTQGWIYNLMWSQIRIREIRIQIMILESVHTVHVW